MRQKLIKAKTWTIKKTRLKVASIKWNNNKTFNKCYVISRFSHFYIR